MDKIVSKLVLGSANFGLEYGLNNQTGKVSNSELKKILSMSEICLNHLVFLAKNQA